MIRLFRNDFLTISTRVVGTMGSTTSGRPQVADDLKENTVSEEQRRYLSYLLRLWQIESGGRLVWRASLEDARTGARQGFGTIDALLVFLREQIGEESDDDGAETERANWPTTA
jgi:hypothetical protein